MISSGSKIPQLKPSYNDSINKNSLDSKNIN